MSVTVAALEGARYEAFVFVGYDEPVTRGALAAVAERAVLIPLLTPISSVSRARSVFET